MRGMDASGRVRIAHRRDGPEAAIMYRLRLNGWAVFPLFGTPGLPDLLCVRKGRIYLVEVKAKDGEVSLAQVKLHQALRRAGLTVPIVSSPDEAVDVMENGVPPRTFESVRIGRPRPRRRYVRDDT